VKLSPPIDSSKTGRVRAALRGEAPDRPPYSFWTHLPGIDLDPRRLAAETALFASRYDIDVVKTMPNGLYCVEDWGCVCDYSDIARGGVAKVVDPAVKSEADWDRLEHVDVRGGAFGRELQHLAEVVKRLGAGVPILATVFAPLTIAGKLSNGLASAHMKNDGEALARGLETITEVTCEFTREALARGCAGIFLAVQEATRSETGEAAYRRFGAPYDARVLKAAKAAGGWFNSIHMHGDDILFDVMKDYDVDALNWHIGETPPAIADYRGSGGTKPILGGLQRAHITGKDRNGIAADIDRALAETQGRGIILAPACVIRHPVDHDTLLWTAERIRKTGDRPPF
jgi:uroporphyrinogen decarboxylase